MQAETLRDAAADQELLHPAYWLVLALPWPGGDTAEGVLAVAPGMIPREVLGDDAYQILAAADTYAKGRKKTVIFFSEMTRAMARAGMTWSEHGIDWERGLAELESGHFPGMYLTISERAYMVVCNPATRPGLAAEHDRDLVRASITEKLGRDWAPYMRGGVLGT
jgi:hypothetical protein